MIYVIDGGNFHNNTFLKVLLKFGVCVLCDLRLPLLVLTTEMISHKENEGLMQGYSLHHVRGQGITYVSTFID
jgi:hypothetical protein